MHSVTSTSFFDELTKIALTRRTMQKMLLAAKKKQIRKGHAAQMGYGYVLPGRAQRKHVDKAVTQLTEMGAPAEKTRAAIEASVAASPARGFSTATKGMILTPEAGDAKRFLQQIPEGAFPGLGKSLKQVKSPAQRKALEAVIKGHEMAESQVKPTASFMGFGHLSPDVILREHNIIQTLPRGMKRAAGPLRKMRKGREAAALKEVTGFEFGKGKRISRHARKHLTRMMDEAAAPHVKANMEASVAQIKALP